jgi:cyclopropane fatty-acyl-phospholipid synthase-like methyltransferase
VLQRLQRLWATANDSYLGIETSDVGYVAQTDPLKGWPFASYSSKALYSDANLYQASDYLNIRRVARKLHLSKHDVFYDIGCGKGRVVCTFATYRLKRVVGIDLHDTLCDIARKNAVRMRRRKTPIEIRCEDATIADLWDGTIFFMYNPFGPATLKRVLDNIGRSLERNRRMVRIVYYNPVFKELSHEYKWIRPMPGLRTVIGRQEIAFWQSY